MSSETVNPTESTQAADTPTVAESSEATSLSSEKSSVANHLHVSKDCFINISPLVPTSPTDANSHVCLVLLDMGLSEDSEMPNSVAVTGKMALWVPDNPARATQTETGEGETGKGATEKGKPGKGKMEKGKSAKGKTEKGKIDKSKTEKSKGKEKSAESTCTVSTACLDVLENPLFHTFRHKLVELVQLVTSVDKDFKLTSKGDSSKETISQQEGLSRFVAAVFQEVMSKCPSDKDSLVPVICVTTDKLKEKLINGTSVTTDIVPIPKLASYRSKGDSDAESRWLELDTFSYKTKLAEAKALHQAEVTAKDAASGESDSGEVEFTEDA